MSGITLSGNILVSATIIILFAGLYLNAMVKAWRNRVQPPTFNEPYIYVATALAGLIGALVAAGFNQQLPAAAVQAALAEDLPGAIEEAVIEQTDAQQQRILPPSGEIAQIAQEAIEQTNEEQLHQDNVKAVGAFALPNSPDEWQQLFSVIYSVVYFVLGLAAIFMWVGTKATTPNFVKSLASIFFALILAVCRSFLST